MDAQKKSLRRDSRYFYLLLFRFRKPAYREDNACGYAHQDHEHHSGIVLKTCCRGLGCRRSVCICGIRRDRRGSVGVGVRVDRGRVFDDLRVRNGRICGIDAALVQCRCVARDLLFFDRIGRRYRKTFDCEGLPVLELDQRALSAA